MSERELLYAVDQHSVVIYSGGGLYVPGSLESILGSNQQVLVVNDQAKDAATAMCTLQHETVGQRIGYSIPFEDQSQEQHTRIKYVSPEMMVWEAMVNPMLSKYRVICVENANERLAWTDIVIALLNKIRQVRKDLKLVIGTVPEEVAPLRKFFGGGSVPVVGPAEQSELPQQDVEYLADSTGDYIESVIDTVMEIDKRENPGSVVVIVATTKQVERVLHGLSNRDSNGRLNLCRLNQHLYSSADAYALSIRPELVSSSVSSKRNIVVTTKLPRGGTSDFLVDCGFRRLHWYSRGANIHHTAPISKSEATQRRSCAVVKCFCMYTTQAAAEMEDHPRPQILGTDLTDIVLRLIALGIDNFVELDYLTKPEPAALAKAFNRLKMLSAVDSEGKITSQGRIMAELPLSIPMAKAISQASTKGCFDELLAIAACSLASGGGLEHLFSSNRAPPHAAQEAQDSLKVLQGDHITFLNIFQVKNHPGAYHLNGRTLNRVTQIHRQLVAYAKRLGIKSSILGPSLESSNVTNILECLASGYGYQLAKRQPQKGYDTYLLVGANNGQMAQLHSSSVLRSVDMATLSPPLSPWVIYEQLIEHNDQVYIKNVSVIDRSMLDSDLYRVVSR